MNNNMDTPIERKSRLKKKHLYAMAGGAFFPGLPALLYFPRYLFLHESGQGTADHLHHRPG